MSDWMDISTAPKDGRPVNLYRPQSLVGVCQQRVTAVWHVFEEDDAAWIWPCGIEHDGWWDDPEFFEDGKYFEATDGFTHWTPFLEAP